MDRFIAAVSLVFGVLAWAQLPLVCGFMLPSTRAGPHNWVYSLGLGGLIAVIGLASALRGLRSPGRRALIAIAVAVNAAFLVWTALASTSYQQACTAIYYYFTPESNSGSGQ